MNIKDEIINKSFYQFLNRGFHACSLKNIEEATGFTKGALYYYFKNKEEILKAGIDKYLALFNEVSQSEFHRLKTLKSYIKKIVEKKEQCSHKLYEEFNYFIIEPLFFQLVIEVSEALPEYRELIEKVANQRLTQWKSIVTLAQERGEINGSIDGEVLARNLLSVSTSMLNMELVAPNMGISFQKMNVQFQQYYNLIRR